MKKTLWMLGALAVVGLLWAGGIKAQPKTGSDQGGPGAGPGQGGPRGGPDKGGPGGGAEKKGPPPESFAACKDKKEGDQCSFQRRDGENIDGTCAYMPSGGELHCRPKNPPPGGGPGGGPGQNGPGGGPGGGPGKGGPPPKSN